MRIGYLYKRSYIIKADEVRIKFLGIISIPSKSRALNAAQTATMNVLSDHLQRVYNSVFASFDESCTIARSSFYTEEKLKAMSPELSRLSRQINVLKLRSLVYRRFQKKVENYLEITRNLTARQEKGTVPDEKH